MKTIYLVRHGEAQNNTREHPVYVAHQSELTTRGLEQARIIAERAVNLAPDVLIASDFLRSQQTASAVAKSTGLDVEISDLFGERHVPTDFVGRPWEEVRPSELEWEKNFYLDEKDTDGENFTEIKARARKALSYLESRSEDKILIITHGYFLRILVAVALFEDSFDVEHMRHLEWGLRTVNTGVTVLNFDPEDTHGKKWHVSVWNDHAHLG